MPAETVRLPVFAMVSLAVSVAVPALLLMVRLLNVLVEPPIVWAPVPFRMTVLVPTVNVEVVPNVKFPPTVRLPRRA